MERHFISLLLNHILILFFRTLVVISRESAARFLPFALSAPEILLIDAINLEWRQVIKLGHLEAIEAGEAASFSSSLPDMATTAGL